jgi:uroporphyrinogen decarboxylase
MANQKPLLAAAQGTPIAELSRTPVWLMRQAGRYLPEYRDLRKQHSTLNMFKTPRIAKEITLQPLRRFDLDGAILYADILLIPDALGLGLSFVEKEGPQFEKTIRSWDDFQFFFKNENALDAVVQKLEYVFETVSLVSSSLESHVTMLGFAGAPFTVASYMIEGGGSKGECTETKKMMYQNPELLHSILNALTYITIEYLRKQIIAGAEVVQLFESWSGALSASQYEVFCEPYIQKIKDEMKPLAPFILFLGQGAHLMSHVGRIHLGAQGNLDPFCLYAPEEKIFSEVKSILDVVRAQNIPFIFNLGHGITQHTPVESVEALVKAVRYT